MKFNCFLLLFIFSIQCHWSQNTNANWEGHFSYTNIKAISKGPDKIYAAVENVIFSLDLQTNSLQTITTIDGLSGDYISTIYYSTDYALLIIGYKNGLIEIFNENSGTVIKVLDIFNKLSIPPDAKTINHFNQNDGLIYIASDFGISVFNLNNLEFGDTYFIGENGSQIPVNQTAILNNTIYAACGNNEGIKFADLNNPNLIDYDFWGQIDFGSFNFSLVFNDYVFVVDTENRMYRLESNSLINVRNFEDIVTDVTAVSESMLVTTAQKTYYLSSSLTETGSFSMPITLSSDFSCGLSHNDSFFIGTTNDGLLKLAQMSSETYEYITPQGPLKNNPFSITHVPGNLWVTFGDYSLNYNPYPLRESGISRLVEEGWKNISYDSIQGSVGKDVYNLNAISPDPNNYNTAYVSSFHSGMLKIDENTITLLDEENSGLESLVLEGNPNYKSVRVSGSSFDSNGNIWVLNSLITQPLKSYTPNSNQWQSFDFSSIITDPLESELGYSEIVIDSEGTKWIGGHKLGLIALNNNQLKTINDEEIANLPSTGIRALALDQNNVLWMGTYRGLRVLYNTANFFDSPSVSTNAIIIVEDGLAKELLAQQFISDIIVDGSNNKWVSTIGAGVFYFSSDGQQTIYQFTKDNSPLPSNNINDMALDTDNGVVFMASDRGLVSFKTGGANTASNLRDAHIYPNPVRPEFNINEDKVKIKGVTNQSNIKITDIEGNLVAEAQSNTTPRYRGYNLEIDGGIAYWNGKNLNNQTVASGVYLVFITDMNSLETTTLKLMLIR